MSFKYQCPLCDKVFDSPYEVKNCMKDCIFEEYSDNYNIILIDPVENIKNDIDDFVGLCGTCRNCDIDGKTFADCPFCGHRNRPDGCDAYVPDTQTFGTILETLWNELKEARA